ncbi:hypothetical protein LguiA_012466 [Lonicera macranthoides]
MTSCSSISSTSGKGRCTSVFAIHRDILKTHILIRLDGPTLNSTTCASTLLYALCMEQKLWKNMCDSTWSSINDPLEITETVTSAFLAPQLCIDLLDRKETMPVPVKFEGENHNFLNLLEESMSLSWILIDPIRKPAANLSSLSPLSVRRYSMGEDVQLLYVTVLPGDSQVGATDPVQCRIVVTCGGEMHVREVNMQVQDMDGVNLSREDSLVILQWAMGCERRKLEKGRGQREV